MEQYDLTAHTLEELVTLRESCMQHAGTFRRFAAMARVSRQRQRDENDAAESENLARQCDVEIGKRREATT